MKSYQSLNSRTTTPVNKFSHQEEQKSKDVTSPPTLKPKTQESSKQAISQQQQSGPTTKFVQSSKLQYQQPTLIQQQKQNSSVLNVVQNSQQKEDISGGNLRKGVYDPDTPSLADFTGGGLGPSQIKRRRNTIGTQPENLSRLIKTKLKSAGISSTISTKNDNNFVSSKSNQGPQIQGSLGGRSQGISMISSNHLNPLTKSQRAQNTSKLQNSTSFGLKIPQSRPPVTDIASQSHLNTLLSKDGSQDLSILQQADKKSAKNVQLKTFAENQKLTSSVSSTKQGKINQNYQNLFESKHYLKSSGQNSNYQSTKINHMAQQASNISRKQQVNVLRNSVLSIQDKGIKEEKKEDFKKRLRTNTFTQPANSELLLKKPLQSSQKTKQKVLQLPQNQKNATKIVRNEKEVKNRESLSQNRISYQTQIFIKKQQQKGSETNNQESQHKQINSYQVPNEIQSRLESLNCTLCQLKELPLLKLLEHSRTHVNQSGDCPICPIVSKRAYWSKHLYGHLMLRHKPPKKKQNQLIDVLKKPQIEDTSSQVQKNSGAGVILQQAANNPSKSQVVSPMLNKNEIILSHRDEKVKEEQAVFSSSKQNHLANSSNKQLQAASESSIDKEGNQTTTFQPKKWIKIAQMMSQQQQLQPKINSAVQNKDAKKDSKDEKCEQNLPQRKPELQSSASAKDILQTILNPFQRENQSNFDHIEALKKGDNEEKHLNYSTKQDQSPRKISSTLKTDTQCNEQEKQLKNQASIQSRADQPAKLNPTEYPAPRTSNVYQQLMQNKIRQESASKHQANISAQTTDQKVNSSHSKQLGATRTHHLQGLQGVYLFQTQKVQDKNVCACTDNLNCTCPLELIFHYTLEEHLLRQIVSEKKADSQQLNDAPPNEQSSSSMVFEKAASSQFIFDQESRQVNEKANQHDDTSTFNDFSKDESLFSYESLNNQESNSTEPTTTTFQQTRSQQTTKHNKLINLRREDSTNQSENENTLTSNLDKIPLQRTLALNRPAIIEKEVVKDPKDSVPPFMKDLKKMCHPYGMPKNQEICKENLISLTNDPSFWQNQSSSHMQSPRHQTFNKVIGSASKSQQKQKQLPDQKENAFQIDDKITYKNSKLVYFSTRTGDDQTNYLTVIYWTQPERLQNKNILLKNMAFVMVTNYPTFQSGLGSQFLAILDKNWISRQRFLSQEVEEKKKCQNLEFYITLFFEILNQNDNLSPKITISDKNQTILKATLQNRSIQKSCFQEPNFSFKTLIESISKENILKLYSCLLLEKKVILIAPDDQFQTQLALIIEAFQILFRPLDFEVFANVTFAYTPDMVFLMEKPGSIVLGMAEKTWKMSGFSLWEQSFDNFIVAFEIESGIFHTKESQTADDDHLLQENTLLPIGLPEILNTLCLEALESEVGILPKQDSDEYPSYADEIEKVRLKQTFFNLNLLLVAIVRQFEIQSANIGGQIQKQTIIEQDKVKKGEDNQNSKDLLQEFISKEREFYQGQISLLNQDKQVVYLGNFIQEFKDTTAYIDLEHRLENFGNSELSYDRIDEKIKDRYLRLLKQCLISIDKVSNKNWFEIVQDIQQDSVKEALWPILFASEDLESLQNCLNRSESYDLNKLWDLYQEILEERSAQNENEQMVFDFQKDKIIPGFLQKVQDKYSTANILDNPFKNQDSIDAPTKSNWETFLERSERTLTNIIQLKNEDVDEEKKFEGEEVIKLTEDAGANLTTLEVNESSSIQTRPVTRSFLSIFTNLFARQPENDSEQPQDLESSKALLQKRSSENLEQIVECDYGESISNSPIKRTDLLNPSQIFQPRKASKSLKLVQPQSLWQSLKTPPCPLQLKDIKSLISIQKVIVDLKEQFQIKKLDNETIQRTNVNFSSPVTKKQKLQQHSQSILQTLQRNEGSTLFIKDQQNKLQKIEDLPYEEEPQIPAGMRLVQDTGGIPQRQMSVQSVDGPMFTPDPDGQWQSSAKQKNKDQNRLLTANMYGSNPKTKEDFSSGELKSDQLLKKAEGQEVRGTYGSLSAIKNEFGSEFLDRNKTAKAPVSLNRDQEGKFGGISENRVTNFAKQFDEQDTCRLVIEDESIKLFKERDTVAQFKRNNWVNDLNALDNEEMKEIENLISFNTQPVQENIDIFEQRIEKEPQKVSAAAQEKEISKDYSKEKSQIIGPSRQLKMTLPKMGSSSINYQVDKQVNSTTQKFKYQSRIAGQQASQNFNVRQPDFGDIFHQQNHKFVENKHPSGNNELNKSQRMPKRQNTSKRGGLNLFSSASQENLGLIKGNQNLSQRQLRFTMKAPKLKQISEFGKGEGNTKLEKQLKQQISEEDLEANQLGNNDSQKKKINFFSQNQQIKSGLLKKLNFDIKEERAKILK